MNVDFSDLEDLDSFNSTKTSNVPAKRFGCTVCSGTGKRVIGYVNVREVPCGACKGRGWFATSPQDRQKAKEVRDRTARAREEERDALRKEWKQANADVVSFLEANQWSSFCVDLLGAIAQYGKLTDGQVAGVKRMQAKAAERVASASAAPAVDLSRVWQLFQTAQANGLKKPCLRVGALALSLAPATGTNPGALYVKDRGEYAGKLTPDGRWFPVRTARAAIRDELEELAADPLGRMQAHGRETGICSCCGAKLTNAESIALGIGPICGGRYGVL